MPHLVLTGLMGLATLALVYRLILLIADRPTAVLVTVGVGMSRLFYRNCFELLTDLTAEARAGYVGRDNRKEGRTAAWLIAKAASRAGKIGIIVGSHRYLCQETAEISVRAWLRENAPAFETLEPLVIYRPLYTATGLWARPYDMFFGELEVDGRVQQRFARL